MRRTRSRSTVVAIAVSILLIVTVAAVIERLSSPPQPPATASVVGVPSPSGSPPPSPSASISASAAPTPQTATTPPLATMAPEQIGFVVPAQTRGVGRFTGDWVFMVRRSAVFGTIPYGGGGEQIVPTDRAIDTLTLVPLVGPQPERRAVAVATFLSVLGNGIAATNQIGAQLSPDGDRVVLSVGVKRPDETLRLGLVIIDLATGAARDLTSDPKYHDDTPAWSPDGKWIAFTRRSVVDGSDAGIWVTSPRPGSIVRGPFLRPVTVVGRRSLVYSWTPDGVWLAISRGNDRYEFFNVPPESCGTPGVCAGGNLADMIEGYVFDDRSIADWRQTTPQFVGAFVVSQRGGSQTIAVAEAPTASRRVVVRSAVSPGVLLVRPRWRPGSEEVLYLESPTGTGSGRHRLLIVDVGTGLSREALARPFPLFAEWTPDGASIAWVEAEGVAVVIRVMRADGTAETAIYGSGGIPEAHVITIDFGTLRF